MNNSEYIEAKEERQELHMHIKILNTFSCISFLYFIL